ncbi:alpha-1,2-mannosidase [Spirosoma linguale DSM 74]|uniref:Alpha-1,2-mannosidase n=2 Tax=Spirosoma TaxID=107 RepID=D2QCX6_SPILD|nr:alpha-1,2-mannosidase [Spirosoma linguale DSM 74]
MNKSTMHRLLVLAGIAISLVSIQVAEAQKQPVDLVNPLVDAANSRWFFFNSASRPFGMVNLSPDNGINADWGAGYRYHQDSIKCFSHIHGWQLSGVPVMPTTGEFKGHLGAEQYGSRFSHQKEIVKAGYHKVVLDAYNIIAELTSTTRVGFHKYTYPASAQSHILFDFSTFLGPSDTQKGYVKKVSNQEIEGYAIMAPTIRRPKVLPVYFVAVFDKPFDSFRGWRNGKLETISGVIEGERVGAYLSFKTKAGEVRKMKVAISYVSEEQARINLKTELSHWDFEKTVQDSRSDWNNWLSRIDVQGGSDTTRSRFYTDLWHALQGRRIISDVNGKYSDMTGPERRIKQIPLDANGKPKFNHHNSDSFWGAQWTINTLWHLVYPEVTESFVNSMVMMYQDGGLIPRGPAGGNYTYVMTGASTTPFIVSAYLKGIRGFDTEKAYEGLRKNHFPGGMMSKAGYEHNTFKGGGIEYYMERGYVPHPLSKTRYGFHQDGSTQTLEYAYQDYTLAQMAKSLGKTDDYNLFMKRAQNYKNVWNPDLGWMWNRTLDGKWAEPVDILRYDNGWEEGNAAQYTWFVPHDVQGLITLMGGREKFTAKLNSSFEKAQKHDYVSGKSHDNETLEELRRVFLNYGNQPSIQTAHLFNYAGAPWLTQYWTRQVIEKVYSGLSPDYGYSGDEDQGLMGSLSVLLKTGLFSTNGGTTPEPFYEISSPIFDRITIKLNPKYYKGKQFVIDAKNNSAANLYIQSAQLNGKPLDRPWMLHETVVNGGTLTLQMGAQPNKSWGNKPEQAPVSMSSEAAKR